VNIDALDGGFWGDGWNDINKQSFLDILVNADGTDLAWVMGAFYYINNDGSLVSEVDGSAAHYGGDDEPEIVRGLRDVINPLYNTEMVFFSQIL